MKKISIICAFALMAFLSSCSLVDLVDNAEEYSKYTRDIESGKLFEEERGTVEYQDGSLLTFKDFGRKYCYRLGYSSTRILFDNNSVSTIDDTLRTFAVISVGESEQATYWEKCPFLFQKPYYDAINNGVKIAGLFSGENIKYTKTKKTIAGKECDVYSLEGTSWGGWHRILFLLQENETQDPSLQAVSVQSEAKDDWLIVPSGYTKISQ